MRLQVAEVTEPEVEVVGAVDVVVDEGTVVALPVVTGDTVVGVVVS
jgi:hypothetical protein